MDRQIRRTGGQGATLNAAHYRGPRNKPGYYLAQKSSMRLTVANLAVDISYKFLRFLL